MEWDGKAAEVPRLRLPLQVVETVNASRADRGTLSYGRDPDDPDDGWRNKLIWGDNLHVLASLAEELAGQVDLIYIDPPFDSRQDYKVRIAVGDGADAADQGDEPADRLVLLSPVARDRIRADDKLAGHCAQPDRIRAPSRRFRDRVSVRLDRVFQHAVRLGAGGVVFSHNHLKDTGPSAADGAVTGRLGTAGHVLGIPLFASLVIEPSATHDLVSGRTWRS